MWMTYNNCSTPTMYYDKTQLHKMYLEKSTAQNVSTKKQHKMWQQKNSTKFALKNKCTGAGSVTRVCWAAKWVKGETLSSAGEVKYFLSGIFLIFLARFHRDMIWIWNSFKPASLRVLWSNCFSCSSACGQQLAKMKQQVCRKCVTFWLSNYLTKGFND